MSNSAKSILLKFKIKYKSEIEIIISNIFFFMKKILLCSEFYYPSIGGVENHNKILYEYFKKKKFKVYIATSYNKERVNKSNIYQFKIKGNFVRGYSGETEKYQKFLLYEDFDVVFFNAAQQWSFDLALPIIEKINSKKILFPCGFSRLNNILYFPYFKLIKYKLNYFDEIICSYSSGRDYSFIKKLYKKKINLINNGANRPVVYNQKKVKQQLGINSKSNIFINISNIKFNKGQGRIIELFNKIPDKNSILFLMGENHSSIYYTYIKLKIFLFNRNNSNKKIYLLSPNEDIKNKLFLISNFFLFGSRIEYDPLVMYESIVYKTKFITYNVGSCINIIKDNLGFVSDDDDKKVEYVMKNIRKKNKIKTKKINKYFWSSICKNYFKIFKLN